MSSSATKFWDQVVASGNSVDAAIGASVSTIWVKSGSVTETIAVDVDNTKIFFEPGFELTGGINITGNNCSLIFGANCSVSAEIDVTTGTGAFIKCENGCSLGNIDVNTARCYVNGGGWGTLFDGGTTGTAIDFSDDDCLVENGSVQSTAGQGNVFFRRGFYRRVERYCE